MITLLQRMIEQLAQRLRRPLTLFPKQGTQPSAETIRSSPNARDPLQRSPLQRVAVLPPIVAHHLGQQFAVVGLQGLTEQAAAVEGVLTQHALTPAVNGGHGCLVHPLRRQLQAAGALVPLRLREITAQLAQQVISLGITAEYGRGLDQARANPIAQFARGSIGEGHHQNLRR